MRAGRRSTISCSARCSSAAARPRSPRPSAHPAGAFSKSASAPAFRCRTMRARNRIVGVDISAPMLRKAQERVAEHRLANVEALAVMDAERLALAGRLLRRRGRAIRHHRGAGSGGDARRIRARAQARRRDRAGQSHRRRERARAALFEQCFAPLARRLGWRPEFPVGAADATGPSAHGGVRVIERRPMPPLGHFSLIRFGRVRRAEPEPRVRACRYPSATEGAAAMHRRALCVCVARLRQPRHWRSRRRRRRSPAAPKAEPGASRQPARMRYAGDGRAGRRREGAERRTNKPLERQARAIERRDLSARRTSIPPSKRRRRRAARCR